MALRSSAVASRTASGDVTATPAGVASGDYLGVYIAIDSNPGTVTPPAEWTLQVNSGQAAPDAQSQRYYDKVSDGSDSFTFNTSTTAIMISSAWTGRNTTTPLSTTPVVTTNTSSNATPVSATISGITATSGDDIMVLMNTNATAAADRWSWSTITDYTEQQDSHTVNWVGGAFDSRENVGGGATGNLSATITRDTGTGNAGYSAIIIAIAAAAGGDPEGSMIHGKLINGSLLIHGVLI